MTKDDPLLLLIVISSSARRRGSIAVHTVVVRIVHANVQVESGMLHDIVTAETVGRWVTEAVVHEWSSRQRLVVTVRGREYSGRRRRRRRLRRACPSNASNPASSAALDALIQVVVHGDQVLPHLAVGCGGGCDVLDLTESSGESLEGGAMVLRLVRLDMQPIRT